jgi:hypothetical protein
MRKRLALFATVSTMVLVLTLSSRAWPQQQRGRTGGREPRNPTAALPERNQKSTETETIRGVVAAVTAEGEVVFDYKSNRAALAEAAFLTVVGSPVMGDRDTNAGDRTTRTENERHGSAAGKRHNVYIVWLTPRTKICEASKESGRTGQAQGQNRAQNKEVALDQLEVGDHVEIAFSREERTGNAPAHQTERMRQKHGRHRTFVGSATSITILGSHDNDQPRSGTERSSTDRSK